MSCSCFVEKSNIQAHIQLVRLNSSDSTRPKGRIGQSEQKAPASDRCHQRQRRTVAATSATHFKAGPAFDKGLMNNGVAQNFTPAATINSHLTVRLNQAYVRICAPDYRCRKSREGRYIRLTDDCCPTRGVFIQNRARSLIPAFGPTRWSLQSRRRLFGKPSNRTSLWTSR